MREKAEAAIQEYLRPLVEADGGRIELLEVIGRRVVIKLSVACSGCQGQPFTLSRVIEPTLRKLLGPDIELEARS